MSLPGVTSRDYLIMAFDHRGSFEKLAGVKQTPPSEQDLVRLRDAKAVVFDGLEEAVKRGADRSEAAVLVDETYGSDVLKRARERGYTVATPVEKSGQDEFDFDQGDPGYQQQLARLQPDFCKVLVRYNPSGDHELNQRQTQRLAGLSNYLQQTHQGFLFELLVPPTAEQKQQADFDTKIRPALTLQAIREISAAGVRPDIWKVEGMDRREDMQSLVDVAHQANPQAGVVVLGRGENMAHISEWIATAATVPGVIGFAVGRTIFSDAVKGYLGNTISRQQAVSQVADNYLKLSNVWHQARHQVAATAA